jgi:O-acetylserine/cysteine efflux transporter
MAFAVANIQMKSLGTVDGHALNAWTAVFAAPLLFAISFSLESGQIDALRGMSWLGVGALAYQVIAMVVLSYWIWYRLLARYAVSQVMPFMLLLPGLAVLFGVLLLDESAEWKKLLGGLMTVSGVAIIIFRRARVTEPRTGSTA